MDFLRRVAVVAVCCTSVACGTTPPTPVPTPPAPSPSTPDDTVVRWVAGYCAALKDMVVQVYKLPKESDIATEADLPKVDSALLALESELRAAIAGLEKLPQLTPPAQDANAIVADRLATYRKLLAKVVEYRAVLPHKAVHYAQSALVVLGVDMVTYKPSGFATDVPGLREVMKANEDCKLVV
ncbi:hypothetical protein ABZX92_44275 [Lentzea sp. NPDC006480]|uniref:hypothetical protein n=1 Tax=Lentzea sp. NPDC006480 TaxID=3157176 RepID=UPI0033A28F8F